ncbi:MAG: D-amino-acid transaminase [Hyphomonadaceae bacterium]|nr:D-amino-acid transaminase [Hyphomonadaceae bacterium]
MSAVAYVNGAYRSLNAATVSIQDRGFQFGDAIYEVWPVRGGRLADHDGHMQRLLRSLTELRIAIALSNRSLAVILREVVRRNRVHDGIVYLQISRGVAPRDHAFPSPPVPATLVVTAKNLDQSTLAKRLATGIRVITTPEIRWLRRDIKSVNLLPNVLARQSAKEAGAAEAWFVDGEGFITEGAASNAWIVDKSGALKTRQLSNDILHGVTRVVLMKLAQERQLTVVEAPFSLAEAIAAREAFITGAASPVVPVIAIDGKPVGDGKPGPVTKALRDAYLKSGFT